GGSVRIATHERDARYLERAEAHHRHPGYGPVKRRTRVASPSARVEDAADRQMGMPWPCIRADCPLAEARFHPSLERPKGKRAFGHTHPQDARALHTRETADAV